MMAPESASSAGYDPLRHEAGMPPSLVIDPFSAWPRWLRPAPDSELAHTLHQGASPWRHVWPLLGLISVPLSVWGVGDSLSHGWQWLAASLPVCMALYAASLWLPRRQGGWMAVAMLIATLMVLPWFPPAMSYYIFGVVLLNVFPQLSRKGYIGSAMAACGVCALVSLGIGLGWPLPLLVTIISLSIVVSLTMADVEKQKQAVLRQSQTAVRAQASAAERERIGRDLHDLLGHTLSLITLKLELSRKLAESDPQRSRNEANEAETVARQALAQVRAAVTGMRATDLHGEIASAGLLLESSGVQWQAHNPPPLPQGIDTLLSLVLREAVTNIARHAQATSARLQFLIAGDVLQMIISDDGRGIGNRRGNGLTGMRERVEALDGVLSIDSRKGMGTQLTISVPMTVGRELAE